MDIAPDSTFAERIVAVASKTPEVVRVEKCRIRKMGNQYLADMHVEVDPLVTVERAHLISHQVKDAIRAEVPAVSDVLVHIEPAGGAKRVRK